MNRELIDLFMNVHSFEMEEAIKLASLNELLRDELMLGEVEFSFRKADGTIRSARGTMRTDRLPEIKGTGRPTNFDLQLYYDLDKQQFRCFKKVNLLGIKK
jgi:hypothetical protein